MKTLCVTLLLVFIVLGLVVESKLSWAKETSYNFVIAYSYKDKVVYHSGIFTQKVDGASFNAEEYVNDTASILKMESAFQKYLEQGLKVNSPDLTVSARVAFKSDKIAKDRMDKEIDDFRFKGFEIKEAQVFKYVD